MSNLRKGIALARRLQTMTPNEIATEAHQAGITGHKAAPNSCLIAEWIRSESGGMVYASVSQSSMNLRRKDIPDFTGLRISNSSSVATFIGMFDHGQFPELDTYVVSQKEAQRELHEKALQQFNNEYGNAIVAETVRLAHTSETLALTK